MRPMCVKKHHHASGVRVRSREGALDARRTHGHRFGAELASMIEHAGPRISGGFDHNCLVRMIGEQDFITAAALHLLSGFLLLGTFNDDTDFARS